MVEALFYKRIQGDKVQCNLCPHNCIIDRGKAGVCLGRKNIEGKLYAINYGEVVSIAMDPIEKKPLYHFHPGEDILSIATYGCNMKCPFCQNWEISQRVVPTTHISPEKLLEIVKRYNSCGVAYTYTEPMIWFEYIMDSGELLKKYGSKIVLVTNGMINREPLSELVEMVDAMNIDLKGMDKKWYRKLGGDLDTVLNTIEFSYNKGVWIEVTNLLVTEGNDRIELIEELIEFIYNLSPSIPLHFSRYFPHYRYSAPPTPVELMEEALNMAKDRLHYVYMGNIISSKGNNTFCPECGNLLIERRGFMATIKGIEEGKCNRCGRKVDVIL